MTQMRYEAPATSAAAVALLAGANGQARVLAGGTDLLDPDARRPRRARVAGRHQGHTGDDIDRVRERRVSFRRRRTLHGAGGEQGVRERHGPASSTAANLIGSIQVKGRATVGGNLCNASPAADTVPALIAAGAIATHRRTQRQARGAGRRRSPPDRARRRSPKARSSRRSCCRSVSPRSGDAYLRFIPRTEMDIAVVGAGVNLTLDGKGVCTHARVSHRRRRRARLAGAGGGGCADRHEGRCGCAEAHGRRRERGVPADRRQARNEGIPDQGRRRDGAARR